ncbi:MAG: hypothetical protein OEL81_00190 [Nitrosopumilus sp.]|nr:hypothetical protein [Nitrosopumilus sp.]
MTDMLEIQPSQAKVLQAIYFVENRNKKTGATQYECKELPKNVAVADSTFNNQKKKLLEKGLIFALEEDNSKPYTITTLGKYCLLKFYSSEKNDSNYNILELIVDEIPNFHYAKLKSIFSEENLIQILRNILISSIQLIHVKKTEGILDIFNQIEESTTIPFYYGNNNLIIKRTYQTAPQELWKTVESNRDKKKIKTHEEKSNYKEGYYAGLLNETELENGLFDRITFSFYNLLLNVEESYPVIHDGETMMKEIKKEKPELFTSNDPESIKLQAEQIMDKFFELMPKLKKQAEKSIEIIESDQDLKKIMKETYDEIKKTLNNTNFIKSSLEKIGY